MNVAVDRLTKDIQEAMVAVPVTRTYNQREVVQLIHSASTRTATGPDQISNMCPETHQKSAGRVEQHNQQHPGSSTLPQTLENAAIIQIPKAGANPSSYRPVSLLSTLSKLA